MYYNVYKYEGRNEMRKIVFFYKELHPLPKWLLNFFGLLLLGEIATRCFRIEALSIFLLRVIYRFLLYLKSIEFKLTLLFILLNWLILVALLIIFLFIFQKKSLTVEKKDKESKKDEVDLISTRMDKESIFILSILAEKLNKNEIKASLISKYQEKFNKGIFNYNIIEAKLVKEKLIYVYGTVSITDLGLLVLGKIHK